MSRDDRGAWWRSGPAPTRPAADAGSPESRKDGADRTDRPDAAGGRVGLWLAGDVMTGRGVDQVLESSVDPGLHERFVKDARRYVRLAEEENGPIPAPIDPAYVWGDAVEPLEEGGPDVRVVNLETAVTTHGEPWPDKGVHYRMHPDNVDVLSAAGVDVCVLANNHALDWGREGLLETIGTLREADVAVAGAGRDAAAARAPAVVETGGGVRLLVFAFGSTTSGVPDGWAAGPDRPGVALLPDLSAETADEVARTVREESGEDDLVVVSLHWGRNWGYRVSARQRRFARRLLEADRVAVVHGHSSHHPRGVEMQEGRPVLYGCGDLINDYEGISGHEELRPELVLLYRAAVDPAPSREAGDGDPRTPSVELEAVPFRLRRMRLERASDEEARWLAETLDRESRGFGTRVELTGEGRLAVRPESEP